MIPNPKSLTVFQIHDRIGLIGDEHQVQAVDELIRASASAGVFDSHDTDGSWSGSPEP